jgi:hypothetical protein
MAAPVAASRRSSTKSGGNQFHGTVFDYHTSSALSANSWINNATRARKIPTHGNEYGRRSGRTGLDSETSTNRKQRQNVLLLHLQRFRKVDSASAFYTVATARCVRAVLTNLACDRFSIGRRSNNFLATVFRKPGSARFEEYPGPDSSGHTPGIQNNYLGVRTTTADQDSWSIKIDHKITDRHMINAGTTPRTWAAWWKAISISLFGGNSNNTSANKPQFVRFNYDWIINPTTNLHVTYGSRGSANTSTTIASVRVGHRSRPEGCL